MPKAILRRRDTGLDCTVVCVLCGGLEERSHLKGTNWTQADFVYQLQSRRRRVGRSSKFQACRYYCVVLKGKPGKHSKGFPRADHIPKANIALGCSILSDISPKLAQIPLVLAAEYTLWAILQRWLQKRPITTRAKRTQVSRRSRCLICVAHSSPGTLFVVGEFAGCSNDARPPGSECLRRSLAKCAAP